MALLKMEGITKVFPGVIANDHIDFELFEGQVHALVGENGAGKTTLMKILYGLYKPDEGSISIRDEKISIKNPKDAISQGIGMVHQHFMLVPPFNAVENIVLGDEDHTAGYLQMAQPTAKIESLMKANNLEVNLSVSVEDLPVGVQQRVEILKILYRGAEILVFDEPTAVLTPQEVHELFNTLNQLKEQGKGIIFISHKLDEVLNIADKITVIRRGKIIDTLDRKDATKPKIAELMVGKPVLFKVDKPEKKPGEAVLEVEKVTVENNSGQKALNRISFSVHEGEIYGIAGVEGNGQSELINAIAYEVDKIDGDIRLSNENMLKWNVRKRREKGLGHIPEDRHRFGLFMPYSLAENMVLGMHHKPPFVDKLQIIQKENINDHARELIDEYDIRTPSEQVPANTLSGGNQQKVIIAREMSFDPELLIAAQPTRGVDIGAQEFIYKQLVNARSENKAVLLISADLDEILSLSDRIGVIYKGKIVKEFKSSEVTKEEVGFYMMGDKAHE
ncbi:MAG: ABC transporter ATP-binding protein [Spirochaetia bacterium]